MKKAYFYVILAAVLWGTMGIFVRQLTSLGINQVQIAFLRVLVATVALIPVLWIHNTRLFVIRIQDLWCFIGTGIISLMLYNLCYFTAIQYATLSVAAVLVYTSPVYVMLFSAVLFKERITISRIGALALVIIGCILVTGVMGNDVGSTSILGIIYGLGAGISYALYSIFGRYALERRYHILTVTFYTFLFSLIGCIPFVNISDLITKMKPEAWLLASGLGILCCVLPYLLYTKGLTNLDNGTAAMLATLEPVIATLVGVFVFHESLKWYNIIGIIVVLAGIVVLARIPVNEKKD